MGYDLDFKYFKFKDLLIADALSRSHTTNHTHSQSEEEIETISLVIQDQSVTRHFNEIAEETAWNKVLQSVIYHISQNWSISKRRLPKHLLPFWSCKVNYHSVIASSTEVIAL